MDNAIRRVYDVLMRTSVIIGSLVGAFAIQFACSAEKATEREIAALADAGELDDSRPIDGTALFEDVVEDVANDIANDGISEAQAADDGGTPRQPRVVSTTCNIRPDSGAPLVYAEATFAGATLADLMQAQAVTQLPATNGNLSYQHLVVTFELDGRVRASCGNSSGLAVTIMIP